MRLAIISPYPTVRAGLAALAREQPGWVVAAALAPAALTGAATPDAEAALDGLDVVLLDLDATVETETVAAWVERLRPRAGVVALGTSETGARPGPDRRDGRAGGLRSVARLARTVIAEGLAFGALPRNAATEEIIAAVGAVGAGLTTLDRDLAAEALAGLERAGAETAVAAEQEETLTAREREVLQLLAQGIPNKQIAQRLSISEHTVKFHVSAIMMKLGAASRTEAVTTAARRGLLLL